MSITRKNPDKLYQPFNNFYAQVVVATGSKQIHVAGTVALDTDRNLVGKGDMARQVEKTMDNIRKSLAAVGATLADVVRVNIFATDVDAYLHQGHIKLVDAFGADTLPASTLVGVTRLAHPDYLVEIQATAVVD